MAVGEAVGATVAIAGAIQRFISMQERTKKVCSLVIDKGPGQYSVKTNITPLSSFKRTVTNVQQAEVAVNPLLRGGVLVLDIKAYRSKKIF